MKMGKTGESGNFQGHAFPALFFLAVGIFFLLLSLKRSRSLPPGEFFCAHYVPEKNTSLMRRLAVILLVILTFGILYEGVGGCVPKRYHNCIFRHSEHVMLYLVYGFVSPVMLLEASGRVPPDSSRATLALGLLLAYVLWNEHALLKDDPTDNRVHALLANLCLAMAAVFAFSVFRPRNLAAYIAGWGMFVLKALWLFSAAVNSDFQKINIHAVGPLLCLEAVLVTLSIVFVGAFFGRSDTVKDGSIHDEGPMNGASVTKAKGTTRKTEYERLPIKDDDAAEEEPRLGIL